MGVTVLLLTCSYRQQVRAHMLDCQFGFKTTFSSSEPTATSIQLRAMGSCLHVLPSVPWPLSLLSKAT